MTNNMRKEIISFIHRLFKSLDYRKKYIIVFIDDIGQIERVIINTHVQLLIFIR